MLFKDVVEVWTSTLRRKTSRSLDGQGLPLVRPLERFGHRPVIIVDERENFGLQVLNGGEQATCEQLAHQNTEPDFVG